MTDRSQFRNLNQMDLIVKIISREYNKLTIDFSFFDTDNLYINATKIAKEFKTSKGNNKDINEWFYSKTTQEYISVLKELDPELIGNGDFIVVRKGGRPQEQGTWIHRKLIIAFARWLSPDFAVWCDLTIEEILKSKQQTPKKPHQTVQVQNQTLVEELQNLKEYKDFSFEILDFVEQLRQKNSIDLYRFDKFMTAKFGESPLNKFKIDLENYYFIPTKLGNFINALPVETNKILEFKGFQTKWNLGFN